MRIFALDCSSVSASVSLLEDGCLLGESFTHVSLTHSRTLLVQAEALFRHTQTEPQDVDMFAVTVGPGSFTGVRIGIAAIKGLADACEKPCFAVSSLAAAAYPFADFDGIVCAAMDARCGQVYTAAFSAGQRLCADAALPLSELAAYLQAQNKPVLFCGDGADLAAAYCAPLLSAAVKTASALLQYPRAGSVALLAAEQLQNGAKTVSASALLPMYLRLPQAQRELQRKQNAQN